MTHEEVIAIKNEIIGECKNLFVLIDDCNETQEKINKRFSNDNTRLELISQQLKIINWVTTGIAGGIVALLIKVFLGG